MPSRSNEFQELVSLIQKHLAPKGAKVTDSAIVGEDAREIDVLIEGRFGPYCMKIAVEAKDEQRKMDLTKFESLVGKYLSDGGIKVSRIVVVTHAGFTKPVIKRARLLDVELLTLQEAKDAAWKKFSNSKFKVQTRPQIVFVALEPEFDCDDVQRMWHEGVMRCPSGGDHGTPKQLAVCRVFHKLLPKRPELLAQWQQKIEAEHRGRGLVQAEFPMEGWTVEFEGKTHLLQKIVVGLVIESHSGDVTAEEFELLSAGGENPRRMHRLSGIAGGKKFSLLFQEAPHPPDRLTLNIRDANQKPRSKSQRKKRLEKAIRKKPGRRGES